MTTFEFNMVCENLKLNNCILDGQRKTCACK